MKKTFEFHSILFYVSAKTKSYGGKKGKKIVVLQKYTPDTSAASGWNNFRLINN
jgi:hypothetical protein